MLNNNNYEMDELLRVNCMDYAKYTIQDRAIADVRDGLKNIHRRIIWSMSLDGLLYNRNRTKSVNAVGSVLRFSPHGDSSVYQACVRLANDSVRLNLIDGKGAFSSTTTRDIREGASRYTEMRLAPITQELLNGLDKNVVNMVNNYDDTRLEPEVLPVSFPLVLCNPNLGIAVGIASNICSFNLSDVIDSTVNLIDNKPLDVIVPDFPTGGELIYSESVLKQINEKGRGTIKLRAKYHLEGNSIVITEIPYTTTREAIIESIIELVKNGNLKEVTDVNDYSGADGLNVTIDFKRNSNVDNLIVKLFKLTPMESGFSCNFTVLVDNKPKTLGIKDILNEWLKFRVETLTKEYSYSLEKITKEIELLSGLETIIDDIDGVINIIRSSKTEKEVITKLKKEYNLTDNQIDYISKIRLINLNKSWLEEKIKKIESLKKEESSLASILESDKKMKSIIKKQLLEVKKKYGSPRRTIINNDVIETTAKETKELLIENYACTFVLTKEGYFKKNLRYNENQKVKDGDCVSQVLNGENKNDLMFFTDKGNVYKTRAYELAESAPSTMGIFISSVLGFEQGEKVLHMVNTSDYAGHLLFCFENGKIARVPITAYETKTNRKMLNKAYSSLSPLVTIFTLHEDEEILIRTTNSKIGIIKAFEVAEKLKRDSQGIGVITLNKKASVESYHRLVESPLKDIEDVDLKSYRIAVSKPGKVLKDIHDWKIDQLSIM